MLLITVAVLEIILDASYHNSSTDDGIYISIFCTVSFPVTLLNGGYKAMEIKKNMVSVGDHIILMTLNNTVGVIGLNRSLTHCSFLV